MEKKGNKIRDSVLINDNTPQTLEKAKYSAIDIAKYLLFLDPKNAFGFREYFTLRKIFLEEEVNSSPMEGNFRLNKLLHMCQIFHCVKHGNPLFKEKMEAFEHGAIVYKIYMNFIQLWSIPDKELNTDIGEETKKFVCSVYNYFRGNYEENNKALRKFSHQDPAWNIGLEQEGGLMPLNDELINYYKSYFYDTLDEIKEYEV